MLGDAPGFIDAHSVFTLEEYRAHYRELGRDPARALDNLRYFVKEGRLMPLRRGLYARNEWVDPWLVASKLASDVVISHLGALAFHGFLEVGHFLPFMTAQRLKSFDAREVVYRPFQVDERRLQRTLTTSVEREGQPILVATLETALVDCLAELELGPDLPDLLDVFRETRQASDPEAMVFEAVRRRSPLLVSRLGFALSCTRDRDVSREAMRALEANMLQRPDYFRRTERTKQDSLLPRWNLILTPAQWQHWRR